MSLFSTLVKPGVCIINEKFNLCVLCAKVLGVYSGGEV